MIANPVKRKQKQKMTTQQNIELTESCGLVVEAMTRKLMERDGLALAEARIAILEQALAIFQEFHPLRRDQFRLCVASVKERFNLVHHSKEETGLKFTITPDVKKGIEVLQTAHRIKHRVHAIRVLLLIYIAGQTLVSLDELAPPDPQFLDLVNAISLQLQDMRRLG